MNETEDRLYALLTVATQQQDQVKQALGSLAAERAALQRERQALSLDLLTLRHEVPLVVKAAVEASLTGAGAAIAAQAEAASKPLFGQLAGVVETARQAESVLRRVALWGSWRLLGLGIGGIAALGLLWWLASAAVLWWDAGAIGTAQVQKAQLETDLAGIRANYDEWVQKGMLGKLDHCDPGYRPCIEIDEKAGRFGPAADYRVIKGY